VQLQLPRRTVLQCSSGVTARSAICVAVLFVLLCGCSFQNRQFRAGDKAQEQDPELHFVEADDYGWFWEPKQAQDALKAVQTSGNTDTIVVVFVAGWHHSAQCCDDNVEGFRQVLRKLQGELARPMYSQAREIIHPGSHDPVRVIGIYLGWRGRSLPGLLDYSTFFGRKAAATRVGDADVREFLVDLRALYEKHAKALATSTDRRLLGLITIGHSFRGQVVLRAISSFLEEELMLRGAPSAYLRLPVDSGSGPAVTTPMRGFGDLVILINPAVEAAAYQRLHALGVSLRYSDEQTPVMLTLSAENDSARKTFFPIGRIAGEFFTGKPHVEDAREREMERQALGFSPEQVTHELRPADPSRRLHGSTRAAPADPQCAGHDHCDYTWYYWQKDTVAQAQHDTLSANECTPQVLSDIRTHDFSGRTVLSDVVLNPTKGNIPHQAFIVAAADRNVIDNHNGMFSEPLLQFLTRYIGFVEAHRFLPLMPPNGCAAGGGSRLKNS
jgi:hypothetical protein